MARPTDRATARSLIVDQRCAKKFARAAERLKEKNRTDHVLHTPDKLTCYLHSPDIPLTTGEPNVTVRAHHVEFAASASILDHSHRSGSAHGTSCPCYSDD